VAGNDMDIRKFHQKTRELTKVWCNSAEGKSVKDVYREIRTETYLAMPISEGASIHHGTVNWVADF